MRTPSLGYVFGFLGLLGFFPFSKGGENPKKAFEGEKKGVRYFSNRGGKIGAAVSKKKEAGIRVHSNNGRGKTAQNHMNRGRTYLNGIFTEQVGSRLGGDGQQEAHVVAIFTSKRHQKPGKKVRSTRAQKLFVKRGLSEHPKQPPVNDQLGNVCRPLQKWTRT